LQGVQAHPPNFLFVESLGKLPENFNKFPKNPGKNGAKPCLTSKNGP